MESRLRRVRRTIATLGVLAAVLSAPVAASALAPGTSIYGTVTETGAGAPIAGAEIYGASTDGGGESEWLATTDAAGHYEIAVAAGGYDLSCYVSNRYPQVSAQAVMASASTPARCDFALTAYPKAFSGYIRDAATNAPVTIASVHIDSEDELAPFTAWGYPDAAGYYEVYAPAGQYTVSFGAAGYNMFVATEEVFDGTTAVEKDCALQPLARAVYGVVRSADSGQPVSGASVVLSWMDETTQETYESWTSANAQGEYEFRAPAGDYTVRAGAAGYRQSDASDVHFDGSTAVETDFALNIQQVVISFSGTVTDARSGLPLVAQVHLTGTDDVGDVDLEVSTDALGHYEFSVNAGTYQMTVSAPEHVDAQSPPLVFDGATTVETDFALDIKPASFSGTVTDSKSGLPLAAQVHLMGTDDVGDVDLEVSTDALGHYEFSVNAGTYQMTVSAPEHVDAQSPPLVFDGATTVETDFSVRPIAKTTALSMKVSAANLARFGDMTTISGALKLGSVDGTGLAGEQVQVQAYSSGRWTTVKTVATTATGAVSWRVAPLSATSYRLNYAGSLDTYAARSSASIKVVPKAYVSGVSGSRYAVRSYKLATYLKPRHASGTKPVLIYRWRRVSGAWKPYGAVRAVASTHSSTTSRCVVKCRFKYTGKWRLRAVAPADSGHSLSTSVYTYLTVK